MTADPRLPESGIPRATDSAPAAHDDNPWRHLGQEPLAPADDDEQTMLWIGSIAAGALLGATIGAIAAAWMEGNAVIGGLVGLFPGAIAGLLIRPANG